MRVSPNSKDVRGRWKEFRTRKQSLNVEPQFRDYSHIEPLLGGKYDLAIRQQQ